MNDMDMNNELNEYAPDLYELEDENGEKHTFELLDAMEYEDEKYYALTPYFEDPAEALNAPGDLVILKSEFDENNDEMLVSIDDDDEFAKERGGFESLADMKAKVAESISSQKKQLIPRLKEQECGRAIAARLEGDVPAEMVASTQQQLLRDFFVNLQRQGMTFDAYLRAQDLTSAQFQEDVKKQADDVTRESLALDALARHLGFDATDEDIDKEFAESGVKDPAATRKEWEDEGRMAFIREGVRRSKASDWLLENAVVTVKDPEAEDEDKPAEEPEKAAEAPAEE